MPNKSEIEDFLSLPENQQTSSLETPDLPEQSFVQEESPVFPSAADFTDEYFSIFAEANIEDVKKAYAGEYKSYLKSQGASGAQLSAKVARINNIFDQSSSATDVRNILEQELNEKEKQRERTTGIERADRFIERAMTEDSELSFDAATSNFTEYYKERLTGFGISQEEIDTKVNSLSEATSGFSNISELKKFFDPSFQDNTSDGQDEENGILENTVRGAGSSLVDLAGKTTEAISTLGNTLGAKYGDVRFLGTNQDGEFKLFQVYSAEEVRDLIATSGNLSDDMIGRLGKDIQELGSEINQDADADSTANKVGQVAGQLLGFIAAGTASKSLAFSTAVLSGTEFQMDDYEQSLLQNNQKFNTDEAKNVAYLGGAIGSLESLPAFKALGRLAGTKTTPKLLKWLDDSSGGAFTRVIKNAVPGAVEEGLQEATSQLLSNLVAKKVVAYDEERDLWEGTQESAEVGAAAGGVVNALLGLVSGNKRVTAQSAGNRNENNQTIDNDNIDQSSQEAVLQATNSEAVGQESGTTNEIGGASEFREPSSQTEGSSENGLANNLFGRTLEQEIQDVRNRKASSEDDSSGTSETTEEISEDSSGTSGQTIEEGQERKASQSRSIETETAESPQTTTLEEQRNEDNELNETIDSSIEEREGSIEEIEAADTQTTSSENQSSSTEEISRQESSSTEESSGRGESSERGGVDPFNTIYPDRKSALDKVEGDTSLIFGNKELGYAISNNPEDAADLQSLINDGGTTLEDVLDVPLFSIVKKNDDESRVIGDSDFNSFVDSVNTGISTDVNTRVNVVSSFDQLPSEVITAINSQQLDTGSQSVPGVTYKGQVYIVKDQIKSASDLQETVYHELYGHAGLRNFYGDQIFTKTNELKVLIEKEHGDVSTYAESIGVDLTPYQGIINSDKLSDSNKNRILIEEILSHAVQKEKNTSLVNKAKDILALVIEKLKNTKLDFIASRFETVDSKSRVLLSNSRNAILKGKKDSQSANTEFDDTVLVDSNDSKQLTPREIKNRYEKKAFLPYLARDWLTYNKNLNSELVKTLDLEKGEQRVTDQIAVNLLNDLEYNVSKFRKVKSSKVSDSDMALITEYLSIADEKQRNQFAEGKDIFQNKEITETIGHIDSLRDSIVSKVANSVFQTVAFRARKLKSDQDLDVYSNFLESQQGETFDFDSQEFLDFQTRNQGVAQSMLLYNTVSNSKGEYFNRSYKVHDLNSGRKWKKIDNNTKQDAIDHVVESFVVKTLSKKEYLESRLQKRESLLSSLSELNSLSKSEITTEDFTELAEFDSETDSRVAAIEKRQEKLDSVLPVAKKLGGWRQYVESELNGDNTSLVGLIKKSGIGDSTAKNIPDSDRQNPIDVELFLENYIDGQSEHTDSFSYFSSDNSEARLALNVLNKRGDIAEPIRKLLGEHKDIRVVLPRTIGKSAEYVNTFSNQKTVYEFLENANLIRAEGVNNALPDWSPLPQGKNWELLSGKYVPNQIRDSLISFGLMDGELSNKLITPFGTATANSLGPLAKGSALSKKFVTALNPGGIARNTTSAAIGSIPAMQGLNLFDIANEVKRFKMGVKGAYFKNPIELREKNKIWLKYGVLDTGIQLRETRRLAEIADRNSRSGKDFGVGGVTDTLSKIADKATVGVFSKTNETLQHLFRAGDNYVKIIVFERLLEQGKKRGLNEQQSLEFAAERTANGYQNFDRASKIAKQIGEFPLAGNFVSFQSEVIRTTLWNIRYAVDDINEGRRLIKQGDTELGNEITSQGAMRAASLGLVVAGQASILTAIIGGSASLIKGLDEEDEQNFENPSSIDQFNKDINLFAGDFAEDSSLVYLTVDDEGRPSFIDVTQQMMHGGLVKAFNALGPIDKINEKTWDKFSSSLGNITGLKFSQESMDIFAKGIAQQALNVNSFGGSITEESDTFSEAADKRVRHLLRSGLTPGYISQLSRYRDAGVFGEKRFNKRNDDNTVSGEVRRTVGMKERTVSIPESLSINIIREREKLKSFNTKLTDAVVSNNTTSDDQLIEIFNQLGAANDEYNSRVREMVPAAERLMTTAYYETGVFGTRKSLESKVSKDLRDALRSKVMNKQTRNRALNGQPISLRVKVSDEKSRRFDDPQELSRRLRLVDKLVKDYNRELRKSNP